MKTLFYLPLIILRALIPINRYTYRPSAEDARARSEAIRNEARIAMYKAKRMVRGPNV